MFCQKIFITLLFFFLLEKLLVAAENYSKTENHENNNKTLSSQIKNIKTNETNYSYLAPTKDKSSIGNNTLAIKKTKINKHTNRQINNKKKHPKKSKTSLTNKNITLSSTQNNRKMKKGKKQQKQKLKKKINKKNRIFPDYKKNRTQTRHKASLKWKNRCGKNNGGCSQICKPKGKTKCACRKGYYLGKNRKKCIDINECRYKNGGCSELCQNTLGGYFCDCHPGFRISDDLKTCQDVNECHLRNGHGLCQDTCTNTVGSYFCDCSKLNGTKLSRDKHLCDDIDECADPYINGTCIHGCVNTFGSYHCEQFQNDQKSKNFKVQVCPPLDLPQVGFFTCLRNYSLSFDKFTKTGRKIIRNSPGTRCKLECPTGFRVLGDGKYVCGISGKWINKKGLCIKSPHPKLKCPKDQFVFLPKEQDSVLVQIPQPKSSVRWEFIKAHPAWAKELKGEMKKGKHVIQFFAIDPASKLSTSCLFSVTIK